MIIILNPSPFDSYLDACDMTKVSYFILNEIEGEQISGVSDPDEIADVMVEKFPDAKIVLTLGSKGSMYKDKTSVYHQDICKVQAVDTTAAGDTFTGYFIAGLMEGMKTPEILKMCAMASGITVSRKGASQSIPNREEVQKALI